MEGVTLSRHAPATAGATLPAVSNPFTAGFVVADRWSSAVACSFTMNGLFGAGRVIDRKSVVSGKSVAVRVDLGGRRIIKKNKNNQITKELSRATQYKHNTER